MALMAGGVLFGLFVVLPSLIKTKRPELKKE